MSTKGRGLGLSGRKAGVDTLAKTKGGLSVGLPRSRIVYAVLLVAAVAVIGGGGFQLARSVPRPSIQAALPAAITVPGQRPALPWPATGEEAVGIEGMGTIATHGGNSPTPLASLVKMMTALVVLQDHPLSSTGEGPSITITPADVVAYQLDLLTQQSVVKVAAGETLTERQALEAMLIPSANNIAAILATWDAGSEAAFVAKMNAEAAKLGMTNTHYASPSGLNPNSTSTAVDQLKLVETDMAQPAFANIVGEPQVTLPVAGLQYNINALVTHDGIVGVKTGFTPQAGGCFAFAAQRSSAGHHFTVAGVVLGQQTGLSLLTTALDAGKALADTVGRLASLATVVSPGTTVARIRYPWGPVVPVVTTGPLTLLAWPGMSVHRHLAIRYPGNSWTGHKIIGHLSISKGLHIASTSLEVGQSPPSPPLSWRLLRP